MDILVFIALVILLYYLYDRSDRASDNREDPPCVRKKFWNHLWVTDGCLSFLLNRFLLLLLALLIWGGIGLLISLIF